MRGTKKLCVTAAVLLLVVGLSAPAGSSGLVDVTGGTLTTALGTFDMTPGSQGIPPCPEKPSSVYFETRADGVWRLSHAFSQQIQLPAWSGNWYQLDVSFLVGSGGTWSGTHPTYSLAGTIGVQIRVYLLQQSGGPVNCLKNSLRCVITGAFSLAATSNYWSGGFPPGLPNTSIVDTITIDTTWGGLVISQCWPPWTSLGGTSATWTGLQLDM